MSPIPLATTPAAAAPAVSKAPTYPVLSGGAMHFVRRWSYGYTPGLGRAIWNGGGARAWFARQLEPEKVADPVGDAIDAWWPSQQGTPEQIFNDSRSGKRGVWEVMADLSRWTVARQIHSTRQVQEQMVSFWSNLLHVPVGSDQGQFYRVSYDQTVRRYALDTFENLLQAAITHPAMGLNLSNAESTKNNPNENLGRELLELHTVGVDAGYTEDDVKASAKMLTGYRVWVWWPSFKAAYTAKDHYTGRLTIMGFTHPNDQADGRDATAAYLSYLARHEATATRLARRLCVKFVNENPSADLVATVAKAYRDNGTAIRPTLLAMVNHPEFLATVSRGAKVRTPMEDYVATVRALGIRLQKPVDSSSFAHAMHWQYSSLGNAPYAWPAPNGYPEVNAAWSSAGRVLTSFDLHQTLASQWWPRDEATSWSATTLLPRLPATLQTVIDTVAVRTIGQKAGSATSTGIATALGMPLSRPVDSKTATKSYWFLRTILSSLLDSPAHLHR